MKYFSERNYFSPSLEKHFTRHSECSERMEHFWTREGKICIYKRTCNILFLLFKHQWNTKPFYLNIFFFWCEGCNVLCSHSNSDLFTCENNMSFSHVKMSCFCAKAHLAFHWHWYIELCLVVRDLNFPSTWPFLLRRQQCFWEKREQFWCNYPSSVTDSSGSTQTFGQSRVTLTANESH